MASAFTQSEQKGQRMAQLLTVSRFLFTAALFWVADIAEHGSLLLILEIFGGEHRGLWGREYPRNTRVGGARA